MNGATSILTTPYRQLLGEERHCEARSWRTSITQGEVGTTPSKDLIELYYGGISSTRFVPAQKDIGVAAKDKTNAEIARDIASKKPAIVGFPFYSAGMKIVYDFTSRLRQHGYSGKIVIGAQHAMALPEESLRQLQYVDCLMDY